MNSKRMKTIYLVIVVTLISKIFGFAREIVLSNFYGATSVSDIYNISISIPEILFAIVTQAIAVGYIPIYNKIKENISSENANAFTNKLITLITIISCSIIIIVISFPSIFIRIFAMGFSKEEAEIAAIFLRISIFSLILRGVVAILSAYAQSNDHFVLPATIGIPLDISIITMIVISYYLNNYYLMICGVLIGTLIQFVILFCFCRRKNYRIRLCFNLKDENIKEFVLLFIPVLLSVGVTQLNSLIDRTLASYVAKGAISALSYADRISNIVENVLVLSYASIVYPLFSKMYNAKQLSELSKEIIGTNEVVIFLIVPISIVFSIFSTPITKVVFERGNFDTNAVIMTSNAMRYYSIGMIGVSITAIMTRAFYSMSDAKTPTISACVSLIINIALNLLFVFVFSMGIKGLALATSISHIIRAIILIIIFNKKRLKIINKTAIIETLKITIISICMGILIWFLYSFLGKTIFYLYAFIISIVCGLIVLLVLCIAFKVKTFNKLLSRAKKMISEKILKKKSENEN